MTEALKLAAADREAYFGDPNFVDVPLDVLLSKSYAAERRALFDPTRAWPGMPPAGRGNDTPPAPWQPDPSAALALATGVRAPAAEVIETATSFLCRRRRGGKRLRRHAERRHDRRAGGAGHRHHGLDVGFSRLHG